MSIVPVDRPRRPDRAAWLRAVIAGEVLGFSATATIAFVALSLGGHPTTITGRVVALVVMVAAGTLEGASLGYFQWRLLHRWLPGLQARIARKHGAVGARHRRHGAPIKSERAGRLAL